MEEKILYFIKSNEDIKKISEYPKEELQLMRMYLNLEMAKKVKNSEKLPMLRMVKSNAMKNMDFIDYILSNKYNVDLSTVSLLDELYKMKRIDVKNNNHTKQLTKNLAIFIDEIDRYNQSNETKLNSVEVIDYILKRKAPAFENMADKSFFENVEIKDLLYVYVILEADLIALKKYEENIADIEYLNIISRDKDKLYVDILLEFYKNKKNSVKMKIKVDDKDSIFKEKNQQLRVYKIAALYKVIIETKKIDIIKTLRELLRGNNIYRGMSIENHYFNIRYFNKIDQLPYTDKTKNEIFKVFNFILNYKYNKKMIWIPINFVIYSTDKQAVAYISDIICRFMKYYKYIDSGFLHEAYMNDIILDKYKIKKIYFDSNQKPKKGMLLINNLENILYIDSNDRNLILNILTDQIEERRYDICTVLYGEKASLQQVLDKYPILNERLINMEIEIENLDNDEVSNTIIEWLERRWILSDEIKEKITDYVKNTYDQSELKNFEYINKVYNEIIINSAESFVSEKDNQILLKDIPQLPDKRELTTILKELNSLVGLKTIKNQIKDLIYLLKFNKEEKIDLEKMNLNMLFLGNPGTGKTTVARLITEILYDLGYINKNKLVEITSKDMIAKYLGQTQEKTYNIVKSAMGGVLFIDEAYSLSMVRDYGNEAIATLIKMMEDYKDKLVIIFAGYEREMNEFLQTNSGLQSRIGYKIHFQDYTVEELMQIFEGKLNNNKLKLTDNAKSKIEKIVDEVSKNENFGNARYINNLFEKILIEHAKNVYLASNVEDKYTITENDINIDKLKDINISSI